MLGQSKPVELTISATLAEVGDPVRHVFFPLDSFISLIIPIERRAQLEVGLVGNEGMLGATLALGVGNSPLRALVQGEGRAWQVEAETFFRELERSSVLQNRVNRYLYVLLRQVAQTAACTRFHVVEARLARWLLMTQDRARSSKFHVTHQFLAYMLGVRRAGVTEAAYSLQRRKLIAYYRGDMEILDARRLAAAACSCYATDKETHARVLG